MRSLPISLCCIIAKSASPSLRSSIVKPKLSKSAPAPSLNSFESAAKSLAAALDPPPNACSAILFCCIKLTKSDKGIAA